jgi:transcriptional repressor of cell division inhibition gene dicB
MEKSSVIQHFGSQQKVADALGITQSAVSAWPDRIPLKSALQIERVTGGLFTADLAVYLEKRQPNQ